MKFSFRVLPAIRTILGITITLPTKYIGMAIDEHLSWEMHVDGILKSLYKYYRLFYHMRHFVNKQLIRTIYYACVYSKIQYGIEVYGTCEMGLINKLQINQNKLLRILGCKDRYYNSKLLHKELGILDITETRDMLILKFVYNCVNGQPIEAFTDYFNTPEHTYNTRQADRLVTDNINTEYGRSLTHYTGSSLWNRIPPEIKNSPSVNSFKNRLKLFMVNNNLN